MSCRYVATKTRLPRCLEIGRELQGLPRAETKYFRMPALSGESAGRYLVVRLEFATLSKPFPALSGVIQRELVI